MTFFVLSVNDPPAWSPLPDFLFNEDDTLSVPLSSLRTMVFDVDDVSGTFQFEIAGNVHVLWQGLSDRIDLDAIPDWNGQETVTWMVRDPHNASGFVNARVVVEPMPDMPSRFSLAFPMNEIWDVWPDAIRFVWRQAVDPDSGDAV